MAFGLICTAALMGNWFPRKKGIALGWATMGAPICTATFVAIMSALYGMLGISRAHVVMGAVMVVLGIVSFFWVKDYPAEVGAYPDNLPDGAEAYKAQMDEMQSYKSPFTVSRLLKDKDMWLISVGFGMLWMVTVGVVSQFVPRMVSVMAPSIGPEAAQGKRSSCLRSRQW
jgi:sugar phosphate permease